jgi:uncharacterized membrane protein
MGGGPYRARPRLGPAMRIYWPWLLPLLLTSVVIFVLHAGKDQSHVVKARFFASAFAALVPWVFLSAPYSFWVLACVLWFFTPFVFALFSVVFNAVLGR